MSNTKTEAQRLADGLCAINTNNADSLLAQMVARSAAAELRRLDAENKQQRAALERKSEAIQKLWAERDQLRAQLDQAVQQYKEDAERYRCIRRGQHVSVINGIGDILRAENLDAAIDAAMAKGVKG